MIPNTNPGTLVRLHSEAPCLPENRPPPHDWCIAASSNLEGVTQFDFTGSTCRSFTTAQDPNLWLLVAIRIGHRFRAALCHLQTKLMPFPGRGLGAGPLCPILSGQGGTRTRTGFTPGDFKSPASAIPPLAQGFVRSDLGYSRLCIFAARPQNVTFSTHVVVTVQ